MKIGLRKPSLKKSIAARTSIKRQVVHRAKLKMPRGYGWIRNPKKYVYNKVYNKTSFSIFDVFKKLFKQVSDVSTNLKGYIYHWRSWSRNFYYSEPILVYIPINTM